MRYLVLWLVVGFILGLITAFSNAVKIEYKSRVIFWCTILGPLAFLILIADYLF